MKVTKFTRQALAVRRDDKRMKALGYRKHETDWELARGAHTGSRIVDVKISADGKHVWTKIDPPFRPEPAEPEPTSYQLRYWSQILASDATPNSPVERTQSKET